MILDALAQSSKKRVEEAKKCISLEEMKAKIFDGDKVRRFHNRDDFAFERALREGENDLIESIHRQSGKVLGDDKLSNRKDISFICEVKKASPSKGEITKDFPYLSIAKEYEEAGAKAISVLTEPEYFKGSNTYLTKISEAVNIPVLRKDFTVDEYQIYEAKVIGADAVLLICTLLDKETMKRYLSICDELGMSALVEAHTEDEVYKALDSGARMIGVNNRNLQTFEVDIRNCTTLRELVPKDVIFVAESGIQTAEDITVLKAAGVDAVLIGETLMRSENKKGTLSYLSGNKEEKLSSLGRSLKR